MKTRPTPTTDRIFANAYDQAMPEHGEGWDSFADRIKLAMQDMEDSIRDLVAITEDMSNGKDVGNRLIAAWSAADEILEDNA